MNCANHPQTPAAAYCRTCGKPLCTTCSRPVMGVIYCETCLAERMAGTVPPAAYQVVDQGVGVRVPPPPLPSSGPHPPIAGILAGFFPFGVGAVYCGQYAKGLAHLIIFVLLIVGVSHATSDTMSTILGLSIGAFYLYQLIDAIKSAKAIQAGQPAPDPFGLGTMFSPGDSREAARSIPTGAIVLIGLGVLFLLHNLDIWFLSVDTLWPIFLIALGAWLLVRRQTQAAQGSYHRSLVGPAVLITVGGLALMDTLHGPNWDHTWPLILVVIGIVKLLERSGHLGGGPPEASIPPPAASSGTTSAPPPASAVNSEVKNG